MMMMTMILTIFVLLLTNNSIISSKMKPITFKKISVEPVLISSSFQSISDNDNDNDNDDSNNNTIINSAIEIRNKKLLVSKFKIRPESASIILENPRMKNVDIEERILELHSTIGLTKPKLKVTLDNYPSLAVDMLSSPVKTIKSIIMRKLEITESEYAEAIRTVQKQNNNRAGFTFFRGNFNFILSILERRLDFKFSDVRKLFKYYPTIFTLDDGLLNHRISFLMNLGYSKYELKDIIISNGRCIFYDDTKFLKLKNFFTLSLGMSTRDFCSLTAKHQRIINLSLNDSIVVKVDHLRDETLWNISNERLCEIITFAPGILTTPASTTEQLWTYLNKDLGMDDELIRALIDDYPGFLRVNKETIALKVEYVVVSEMLLMASRSNLLGVKEGVKEVHGRDDKRDVKMSLIKKIFNSMASKILTKAGMAFTCSLERLQSRLQYVSNTKICPNFVNSDEDSGDIQQHPDAGFITNALSLKKGAPMWIKPKVENSFDIDDPHIDGIMFLTSILSYESVLELIEEWEKIDRNGLLSSLPAPPLYCFLYSETKFNKWLHTIPRSYKRKTI